MKQILPPANAAYSASAKTITFSTTIPASISHILHVTNITKGVLLFQPQAGLSGTYTSPTLTFTAVVPGAADTDKLLIFYEDGISPAADGTDITSPTAMPTGGAGMRGWLSAIWTKLNNLLKVQISDGTNDASISTGTADATPATLNRLRASVVNMIYNGTSWDMWRGDPTNGAWVNVKASALPTNAAQDGTDITSPTAMPTGGTGMRGWLSAIWTKLNNLLKVQISDGTNDASISTATTDATPATLNRLRASVANLLFNGTSWDMWRGDTTSGAWVNIKNTAVSVGGFTVNPTTSPTLTAASAYASGNTLGGVLTFANCVRGTTGTLWDITIESKSAQNSQVDLLLFSASPSNSTISDKTAVAIAVLDFNKVIGAFSVFSWVNMGTTSVGTLTGIGKTFVIPTGTSLFGVLVTRATPTFTATSDLTVVLGIAQD